MSGSRLHLAIDVGGILYYDEPFELAWLQGVHDRLGQTDPTVTTCEFIQRMSHFYLRPRPGSSRQPSFFAPLGTESWRQLRRRWATTAQPIHGAVEALALLCEDHEVSIVANQPPECQTVLRQLGVDRHVKLVALDSLVGLAKPDLRIYQWAFARLGWTPQTTVIIGDREDHDVTPAIALGCRAALIQPDSHWVAPAGIAPEIETAYRTIHAARRCPPSQSAATWSASSLADLCHQLRNDKGRALPSSDGEPE